MDSGTSLRLLLQPIHPPYPHKHVSPEAALLKAVLVSAVLVVGAVFAVIRAWQRWRRPLMPTATAGRALARNGRRRRK